MYKTNLEMKENTFMWLEGTSSQELGQYSWDKYMIIGISCGLILIYLAETPYPSEQSKLWNDLNLHVVHTFKS